jgi:hypothetical protein
MTKGASKERKTLQHKLVKLLPFVDLELGLKFFEQIKIHYSNIIDPKMT